MATLQITEFFNFAHETAHPASALLPGVIALADATNQSLTFTSTKASAAFAASTNMIRVIASAVAHINVGVGPQSTAASLKLAANVPEYFAVPSGASYKVSAYDGTTPQSLPGAGSLALTGRRAVVTVS